MQQQLPDNVNENSGHKIGFLKSLDYNTTLIVFHFFSIETYFMTNKDPSIFLTKERLASVTTEAGYKPTVESYNKCAEAMYRALKDPNQMPNMITFIELEQ